ncbi:protein containg PAS domain S-box [Longilinea arvoryzae]|uniref:histidine kinase n=1 Tax=Longilinea arvoryzae TaxID=360412 RepID=A0A0S7BFP2_9CHLR|nr:GAF domain-containing protein [Longilinea arvoryzae]GAP13812.1 protein containg PAS domain S-box [Longilinea arvoryzae]
MGSNPYVLGLVLGVLGVALWLFTRLALRSPWVNKTDLEKAASPVNGVLSPHQDAWIVVQLGGRVSQINQRAREVFRLDENEPPDLEVLARRVRPGEEFLTLCASEGHGRFLLDGRLAEATSYYLHTGPQPVILLTIRFPELGGRQGNASAESLQFFTQMGQAMGSSLDLDATLEAILENVAKLLPTDVLEVTLWDKRNENFIPYRMIGLAGLDRHLEKNKQRYPADEGYTGYLARERKPLVIPDVEQRSDLRPVADSLSSPVRSYLGLPLLAGEELIGTLELGSLTAGTFSEDDLEMLELVAGQAATAIHNALLYQEEQRRSAELSGLSQLAQAFSSIREPRGLFGKLVQSTAPLLRVKIFGFLLYKETTRTLDGQNPFYGLPPEFIETYYRAEVAPGSQAEQTLLDQDVIITENAMEDPQWIALGYDDLAQGASLHDSVLIPLTSGGRMLGYLQASNHVDGSSVFTQDELHLLMIIANQSAPIIENATLVQQSRERAQRAEALRRISSLTSSTATLDEILHFSIQELARLLRADSGAAFLLNQDRSELCLHPASLFGSDGARADHIYRLRVEDPQFPFTLTGSQHGLLVKHFSEERNETTIVPFFQTLLAEWQAESVVAVPLVVRDEGVGELWFGCRAGENFAQPDLQAISTAAGQLAGVVEQAFLSVQTDEGLRRRLEQLTALTRISRELSTSLDLTDLLKLIHEETLHATRATCASVLLFEQPEEDEEPRIRQFVGCTPRSSLSEQEMTVYRRGEPVIIQCTDVEESAQPHPGIESILIVPLIYHQATAGLIELHAEARNRFDDGAVEITQSLAAQAAVALGNALQYDDLAHRSEKLRGQLGTLGKLFQAGTALRPNMSLQDALKAIADAIQDATPFQTVLISSVNPNTKQLVRLHGSGIPADAWEELRSRVVPWQSVQNLLKSEYRCGSSYFIPADQLPEPPADVHMVTVLDADDNPTRNAWNPDDILCVPIFTADGEPMGLISLDAPNNGQRPDEATFDVLNLFSNQVALVLENQRTLDDLRSRLQYLQTDYERQEQAARSARESLPVLMHQQLDQTMRIRDLNCRMERIKAGMALSGQAASQKDTRETLRTMANEMIARFDLQSVLVGESTPTGPRLVDRIGNLPAGANPEALFGQRNPLRQTLQDGKMLLTADLEAENEWRNSPLLAALNARSFITMPFEIASDRRAVLLGIGPRAMPSFTDEDRRVITQVTHQVSMALQNVERLNQTRQRLSEVNLMLDYAHQLSGNLNPEGILRILVETAMRVLPAAQAGWVGLVSEKENRLVPRAAVGYRDVEDLLAMHFDLAMEPPALPVKVLKQEKLLRIGDLRFASEYPLPPEDLLHYQHATGGRLPVASMAVPLQFGARTLGVLVLEDFVSPASFTVEDEALLQSLAQQTVLALENARLFQSSENRAAQMQALNEVAGTITSSLQSDDLIDSLLDQLGSVVPYNTATLWLRDGDQLSVAATTGFDDNESRAGLAVAVEDSALFQEMIGTEQALSVADVRLDSRFPSLIEPDYLSWLGIPLLAKSELTGVIALEKDEAGYYSPEHIQAATTFAGQAAVALENARLFEESQRRAGELDRRSQRLQLLNRFSSELSATLEVDLIFKLCLEQFLSALGGAHAAVILTDAHARLTLQSELPESSSTLPRQLPPVPLLERLSESHGIFSTSNANLEPEVAPLMDAYLNAHGTQSLLVVPLVTAGSLQGWLLLESQREYRFSPPEIELARTIANQSAIAIQNARLFAETRHLTTDLEKRVDERTAELSREHRNSQTLLRVTTELSASLEMGLVLNRTLAVLNESLGSEQSVILMSQTGSRFQAGEPLVDVNALSRLENDIARWMSKERVPALVDDMHNDARWNLPEAKSAAYASMLAVPLILGADFLGTLLLLHRQPKAFIVEQAALVEAAARQISIALNNAEVFNLIRDQSERLGGMLRDQQIEASRSRAILEAVADGVVVTDANNTITLFNASAERILGLKNTDVIGQSLDSFLGVFGRAARTWSHTIHEWSNNPQSATGAESYSEQISLENDQVISVHLAPVSWRSDFLGTVSIFRDITHEVQVDRLKSEFVANVSHELRTPLTSIKGYVEIMLMGAAGQLTAQQNHFLDVVKTNSERLNVLVNDLLDISRIEAGRVTLSLQPLSLAEIAADVTADLKRRSREENKPMTVEAEVEANLPQVDGDMERIQQVMANLVNNAYNYSPEDGVVRVHIFAAGDDEVQIDVIDKGIGIEPREQARIFQRFYRGDDPLVLATAGTGLGLAISKILVEMHHGRIWFHSAGVRGEGSIFSFTLPVTKAEEELA